MTAALKPDEFIMRGVRRVLIEHIDSTRKLLQRDSRGAEFVHEARKQMKRIRAGLRLLRKALGETTYRRLNRSIRDAARPLTPVRDAKILCDALDDVMQQAGKSVSKAFVANLRRTLRHEQRLIHDKSSNMNLDVIGAKLDDVKQRLQSLQESRLDRTVVDAALKRAYKKAYKAFALAEQQPSNEHLHEWRKQVKYGFHQLKFIQSLKPERIGTTIKQAHRLADHLGDDHDLALLHEKIALHATQKQASVDTVDASTFIIELKCRRAKLQRKACRLGQKLYARKPKQVAKQMNKYVAAWRQAA